MRTNLSSILNNNLFILLKLFNFKPYKHNTTEFNRQRFRKRCKLKGLNIFYEINVFLNVVFSAFGTGFNDVQLSFPINKIG